MKRIIATFALLLIMSLFTLTTLAQDTPAPTDEISAATAEPTALVNEEPTSELASATPLPTGTPLPTATDLPTLTKVPDFTPTPDGGTGGDDGDTNENTGDSVRDSVITIVMSVLALVLGGGTVLLMAGNFRKDKAGVAATEKLGDSVPKDVALALVNLLRGVSTGAEIAIEALDRVPAAEKPPVLAQFTIAELNAELARRASAG